MAAIDYLVGVDFGAGETSASYYDVSGRQSSDKETRLHRLSIVPTGDVSKIYSAIKKVNGEWRLVTDPTDFICSDLRVDFKRRPSEMSVEQRDMNKKFFGMVFKSILANNSFLLFNEVSGEKNFFLLAARPTSWSEDDEDAYLALMREAGLPVDQIVNESDAALAKWDQYARQGNTLVVDCGSSTIDLTLVQDGRPYNGSLYSCVPPQGAKRVEELLKQHFEKDEQYVSDCRDVQTRLMENGVNLSIDEAIKMFLRNEKERFYTNTTEIIYLSLKKRPFIREKGDIIDDELTRTEFEYIVSPYFDELRRFFRDVRDTLSNSEITVGKIILSGGAARMPLVKQILSDVFTLDDSRLFHDKVAADFVVSDGLAVCYKDSLFCADYVTLGCVSYQDNSKVFLRLDATKQIVFMPPVKLSFYDIHKNLVFEKIVNNISFDNDHHARVEFEIEKKHYGRYYSVSASTSFEPLGIIELYPSEIRILVNNLYFRMDYVDSFYRAACAFPLWWMLMPNTTRRDIRYIGYRVRLDEISSGSYFYSIEGCVSKIKEFLERLCSMTELPFSLVERNDYDKWPPEWIRAGSDYFDQSSASGEIIYKLSLDEYKDAISNGNSHLLSPNTTYLRNWGIIGNDGNYLSFEDSKAYLERMLESRYNGLY